MRHCSSRTQVALQKKQQQNATPKLLWKNELAARRRASAADVEMWARACAKHKCAKNKIKKIIF